MAVRTVSVCALLLSQAYFSDTVPPTISFVPLSPLVLSPNDTHTGGTGRSLAITCTQPAGGTLTFLALRRNSSSSAMFTLLNANVEAPPDGTNGLPMIVGNIQGATAAGSLTQRSITLTFTSAFCDHTGMYDCFCTLFVGGQYLTFETFQSYSVTVGPGEATITITLEGIPSGKEWYVVGDTLILRCNIDVGTVESTLTKVDFVWQYEDTAGSQLFLAYPNLDDIDNTEEPTLGPTCQTQTRISKLRRNLTIEDSYRQYRCYISKGGQTYVDLAGSVDIPLVKYTDSVPDSHHSTTDSVPDFHHTTAVPSGQLDKFSSHYLGGVVGGSFAGGTAFGILLVLGGILLLKCYRRHVSTPAVGLNSNVQQRPTTDMHFPSTTDAGHYSTIDSVGIVLPTGDLSVSRFYGPGVYDGLRMTEVGSRNPYSELKISISTAQPVGTTKTVTPFVQS